MFSVEVVCMSMEGVFLNFYVVERDRKTTFDPFICLFFCEKENKKFWEF